MMTTNRTTGIAAVLLATLAFAGTSPSLATVASRQGQPPALVRGNAPGEWRYWGADAWSTRYSPLDQINASQLRLAEGRLAVERRRLRQRRVLPHDAALRERPALHRRDDAPRSPSAHRSRRTARRSGCGGWTKASAGRRRRASSPDAGSAYWTDGANERVIVVTPGYHMASLDAKTGIPDPKFGKNGVVDLMDGLGLPLVPLAVDDTGSLVISDAAPARKAKPGETWDAKTKTGADGTVGIDPALGQIAQQLAGRSSSTTSSSSATRSIHGYYPIRLRNLPGYIRGFDVRTGKQLWKFNLVPQPGEFGADTWKNGIEGRHARRRQERCVGDVLGGSRAGPRLHPGRHAADGRVRRPSARRQPVRQQPRRARREDRQAQVALPDGAPRHLGLRHADGAEPARRHGRRPAPRRSSRRRRKQGWVYVFDRVTGEPIWPIVETPVLQSEVPGEQASPTQPIPEQAGAVLAAGTRRSPT